MTGPALPFPIAPQPRRKVRRGPAEVVPLGAAREWDRQQVLDILANYDAMSDEARDDLAAYASDRLRRDQGD